MHSVSSMFVLETDRFCPANHVQPVLSPALAVVGRVQESVDEPFVRLFESGRGVQHLGDLLGRRRQPGERERTHVESR